MIGVLNRLRWHADDRLRRGIHHHRFSVTDFARIRRGLLVVAGRTVENDFSGKPRCLVGEVGIDLFAGQAKVKFEKALELNPNSSVAHYRYGFLYLAPLARHDDAIREMKRALELEPLSLIINANLAGAYMFAGQNDRALQQARKTYDLEPNFVSGHYWLGLAYNANGMYAEAIALSERDLQTDSTNQYMLRVAGYGYATSGRRREAEEVIKRFKDIAKTRYVMSYCVASIYAALGDKDNAFIELENAFVERDFHLHRLKVDPVMNPLHDDPRFQDLMRRIGLPQ